MNIFTSKDIADGALRESVPELYALCSVHEINPWHNHQSVFDHTVAVVAALEYIFQFDFLYADRSTGIRALLETQVDGFSRKDIALLSGAFHDIAKGETIIRNDYTGQTECPDHEKVGSRLASVPLRKLKITGQALKDVKELVKRHGEIHEVVNRVLRNNEPEKEFSQFKNSTGELYVLFLIQGYADMIGSDLRTLNPKEFKKREIIYREALNRFATAI